MQTPTPTTSETRRAVLASAVTLAACLVILTVVMQLWRADWNVPFAYSKDALLCAMLAKTVAENGWYLHNPLLGAPGGLAYYDYPFGDAFHFALLQVLSLATPRFGTLLNVFFVLSFPMAALTALYALRALGLTWESAVVGALLYAFLPYHFLRGEAHLFLSMYWSVPGAVLVMLWLGDDILTALPRRRARLGEAAAPPHAGLARRRLAWSLAACVLLGVSGFYYAYFACVLFVVAGAEASARRRCLRPLITAGALAGVVAVTLIVNVLPNLSYWRAHGSNAQITQRAPQEAEYYGLKIAQLLLPVTGHRLPGQARLKDNYNDSMLLINENDDSTLGIIGSLGFLLLLACLAYRGTGPTSALLGRLATLNIFAVLLGTVGGAGSLVALSVLPQIRSYNRISIFLAFFALCAFLAVLDAWRRQAADCPRARRLGIGALCFVLVVGLFDQTSPDFVPRYAALRSQFYGDQSFVRQVEGDVPRGALVFQLPYVAFPTNGLVGRMTDYEELRPYLHSRALRWSYGAMRGRGGDDWLRAEAGLPVPALRASLTAAGFAGVCVDTDGYPGRGQALAREWAELTPAPPLASRDGRLLFFRLPMRPAGAGQVAQAAVSSPLPLQENP